jgi:hypothetical protein
MNNPYICYACGIKYLTREQREQDRVSTWHEGTCCECGHEASVTHVRAYNYCKPKEDHAPGAQGEKRVFNVTRSRRASAF